MENQRYLSVSALNKYLYYKFDNDLNLRNVYLKAEISNIRLSKGILYFVLKDNESEISALMYESILRSLNFQIEDGMTVLVCGRVGLYHKRGTYAITVSKMEAIGLGEAYLNFIKLKEKLLKEGLFDDQYKREIKRFNHKIALITSATGDARHDVESTIAKRYPLAEVVLYPALVQGTDAPKSLIAALNQANQDATCDCIIIARGGGSIEDLSCFNDEELARCIFDSAIPVISGVGHEADFTICDFVSDRRAPTPTGAAVIASPDMNDLYKEIVQLKSSLVQSIKNKLVDSFAKLETLKNSYVLKNFVNNLDNLLFKVDNLNKRIINLSPINEINHALVNVDKYKDSLNKSINKRIELNDYKLDNDINKLILLNPLNIMSKGYTITFQDGKVVSKIEDVDKDKSLNTKILGGEIISTINEIKKDKEN